MVYVRVLPPPHGAASPGLAQLHFDLGSLAPTLLAVEDLPVNTTRYPNQGGGMRLSPASPWRNFFATAVDRIVRCPCPQFYVDRMLCCPSRTCAC